MGAETERVLAQVEPQDISHVYSATPGVPGRGPPSLHVFVLEVRLFKIDAK